MIRHSLIIFSQIALLLLVGCAEKADEAASKPLEYVDVGWEELKPEGEEDMSQYSHGAGGYEDDGMFGASGMQPGAAGRYTGMNRSPGSSKVMPELDGKAVRIPGFIVPVEYQENIVTEFFLVPYFGACFHMPPPPPNQTIYVTSEEGVELSSIYDPYWLKGVMEIKQKGNEIANAAYSLKLHSTEPYTY